MCTVDNRSSLVDLFEHYEIDTELVDACFEDNTLMVISKNDNPIVDALIMGSIYVESFDVEYSFKKMLGNCTTDKPIILEGSNGYKCHVVPVDEDITIVHCHVNLVKYSDYFKNARLWKKEFSEADDEFYWSL